MHVCILYHRHGSWRRWKTPPCSRGLVKNGKCKTRSIIQEVTLKSRPLNFWHLTHAVSWPSSSHHKESIQAKADGLQYWYRLLTTFPLPLYPVRHVRIGLFQRSHRSKGRTTGLDKVPTSNHGSWCETNCAKQIRKIWSHSGSVRSVHSVQLAHVQVQWSKNHKAIMNAMKMSQEM